MITRSVSNVHTKKTKEQKAKRTVIDLMKNDKKMKLSKPLENISNNERHYKRSRMEENDEATTSGSDSENDEEANLLKHLEEILGQWYANVVDRLQLNFEPICIKYQDHCKNFHIKEDFELVEVYFSVINTAEHLLSEDQPQLFLKLVSNINLSNKFPGKKLLRLILELILTINKPYDNEYKTEDIIRSGHELFESIFINFPPCHRCSRQIYAAMLLDTVDINFRNSDGKGGIFRLLMDILENVISDSAACSEPNQISLSDSFSDPTNFDFYQYEKKVAQKFSFDLLHRDEKIDRVFLVLHLLVKLMESDLAIWIWRFPKNMNAVLNDPTKVPLIGSVLWGTEQCGNMNLIIKKIISIFINCIRIGMPKDKIDILSRLLNLVANIFNLCEMQIVSNRIEFPIMKSYTETLADEIIKEIQKNISVDLYQAVIDNIQTPFIRLLLISHLLMKLDRFKSSITMENIYTILCKEKWNECSNDGKRNIFPFKPYNSSKETIYPIYNQKALTKSKVTQIYHDDYIELIYNFFESYLFFYRTKDVLGIKNNAITIDSNGEQEKIEEKIKKYASKHFNLSLMGREIEKLQKTFIARAKNAKLYYIEKKRHFPYIFANTCITIKYREDIKWLLLLRAKLTQLNKDIKNPTFMKWMQHFENIEG